MTCKGLVGVKNILLTFYDCDTDQTLGPISHKLASDTLPTWKTCPWANESLPNGYTRRSATDVGCTMEIIRDLRVPLAWYQGCVSINAQVEMENGLVYTGVDGGALGTDQSDTHAVTLTLTFRQVDELLPAGALAA